MSRAWVGLALFVVACSQPESERPVVPKHPEPQPAPPVIAAKPPTIEQKFAPTPAPAFADPDRRAKLAAAFPKLDKELEQLRVEQHVLGISIGVVIDGELAYSKGFGVVDPTTKAVPDADTVYRIGSISKSFTGLALLSLRDDGALHLDDPLAKWIPEANGITYTTRDAGPITLRQLAQHASGLPRMAPFDWAHGPDEATVVGSLAKITLERAPGIESVYSNLGFALLGIVVSHAAKQPLHDVIAARIFQPLGMTSSSWDAGTVPAGKLAPAFTKGPDGGPQPQDRLGAADGAGGIYSSVRDMARYAGFLLAAYPPRDDDDRGPIKRATIREAQLSGFALAPRVSPKTDAKRGEFSVELDAGSYGFGWAHRQTCTATDIIEHNGRVDSYTSDLALRTSSGIAVIVMTNFDADTGVFADRVLAVLEATGAMKPRVPALPDPTSYTPVITAWLDVYNAFDNDKLAAILNRPVNPREAEELAGYKATHGKCTAFKFLKVVSDKTTRFALTCDHGPFELDAEVAGSKLNGFTGRTPNATAPDNVRKLFAANLALLDDATWNEANYKLAFPTKLLPPGIIKEAGANFRNLFGTCKQGVLVQAGFGWELALVCSKAPATLTMHLDAKGVIDQIFFQPADGSEPPRCPTK